MLAETAKPGHAGESRARRPCCTYNVPVCNFLKPAGVRLAAYRRAPMKARTYLILMAAAILVPVTLIASAGLSRLLQSERESRIRSVQETGRATALAIDREIAVADASLRGIVNSEALRRGDFALLHREASAMNRDTPWSWTLLMAYSGEPKLNTLVPWGAELPAYRAQWVGQVYDAQKTRVSGYFVGILAHRPTVSVDVPVPRASGERYVVSQIFDASYFGRVFQDPAIGRDWVITIFDANGISIARNRNAEELVGKPVRPELYRASRAQPNGILRHTTHDGVDVYSVYTRAPLSGWTLAIGVPAPEIEAPARTATLYAALSLLAMLGLAIGISVFLAKRLSVSLDQARMAAQALAGGAEPPAAPTRVAEVDMLLEGLRHTSADLARERAARQHLEEEREALLRSEQDARRQAEAQSNAKDVFLAMLGHELRNPLAAIAGAVQVLDLPGVKPELAAHARAVSQRQVRHLTRIVDDLLDMRRILSGKVSLRRRTIDAGALLRQCCETRKLADAGVHVWQVEAAALWVDGDPTRLEQIFDNLLHNAIKYTPAGGVIAVRARSAAHEAVIEVSDSGVGIDAATLPTIFDPLVQGPTGIDRAQGGLGLGLALVKELAALHGGSVGAHSEGPGLGSSFTLRFPLAQAPADAPA
jgi:signal transduction histidine kinase